MKRKIMAFLLCLCMGVGLFTTYSYNTNAEESTDGEVTQIPVEILFTWGNCNSDRSVDGKMTLRNMGTEELKFNITPQIGPSDENAASVENLLDISAKIVDENGTEITDKVISVNPGESKNYTCSVTLPETYTSDNGIYVFFYVYNLAGDNVLNHVESYAGFPFSNMIDISVELTETMVAGDTTDVKVTVENIFGTDVKLNYFWIEYASNLKPYINGETTESKNEPITLTVKDSEGNEVKSADIAAGTKATFTYSFTVPESWNEDAGMIFGANSTDIAEAGMWGNDGVYQYYEEVSSDDTTEEESKEDSSVDVEVEEGTPEVTLTETKDEEVLDSVFSKEELESGKKLDVKLEAGKVEKDNVAEDDYKKIEQGAGNKKIAVVLDLNIYKIIDDEATKVTDLNAPIKITIDVPEEFVAKNRQFSVVKLHDGEIEVLKDLDDSPNTITFETDKFSLYTIVYEDMDDSPKTGDMSPIAMIFAMLAVSGAGILLLNNKRERS